MRQEGAHRKQRGDRESTVRFHHLGEVVACDPQMGNERVVLEPLHLDRLKGAVLRHVTRFDHLVPQLGFSAPRSSLGGAARRAHASAECRVEAREQEQQHR